MIVPKSIKHIFDKQEIVLIDRELIDILTESKKYGDLENIIDFLGNKSSKTQGLNHVITTLDKVKINRNRVYTYYDEKLNEVIGLLKVGKKKLFLRDEYGEFLELSPLCVLDFYVHEKMQRKGIGLKLFNKMLEKEKIKPDLIAYDRPSIKLKSFLRKHFQLSDDVPQTNNFVVYQTFFQNFFPKKKKYNDFYQPISRSPLRTSKDKYRNFNKHTKIF